MSIKEKYSSRELERALNSAQFERTMLSNKVVSTLPSQFPVGIFKDPYIFELKIEEFQPEFLGKLNF